MLSINLGCGQNWTVCDPFLRPAEGPNNTIQPNRFFLSHQFRPASTQLLGYWIHIGNGHSVPYLTQFATAFTDIYSELMKGQFSGFCCFHVGKWNRNNLSQTPRKTDRLCYTSGVSFAMSATPSAPSSLFSSFRYQAKCLFFSKGGRTWGWQGLATRLINIFKNQMHSDVDCTPMQENMSAMPKFQTVKYVGIHWMKRVYDLIICHKSKMWILVVTDPCLCHSFWSRGKNFQTKPCLWVVLWVGQQLDPQMNAGKLLEVTNEQIDFVEPKFSYFEHTSPIHTERRDKGNIWRGMPCHSGIWHRQKDR